MATSTIKQVTNNSESGYCKMPDGTMIQWGIYNAGNVASNSKLDGAISFQIPFHDTNPTVTANIFGGVYAPVDEATGPNIIMSYTDSFRFRLINKYSSALNVKISWLAIGRWK